MMLMIFCAATLADWNKMQSVNVVGTMLCYKYAAMQMIKQGRGGRIIGTQAFFTEIRCFVLMAFLRSELCWWKARLARLLSRNFLRCSRVPPICSAAPQLAAYCASKFAIRGLTQAAGTPISEQCCVAIEVLTLINLSSGTTSS